MMGFLLDTCLVSEFFKKQPDANVIQWFGSQRPETLFLSVLTIGELRKGLLKLPPSQKTELVGLWLEEAKTIYGGRILKFDLSTAETLAKIRAMSEADGKPISMIDSLIAATAVENNLTIATRNVRDFEFAGVRIFNPWVSVAIETNEK